MRLISKDKMHCCSRAYQSSCHSPRRQIAERPAIPFVVAISGAQTSPSGGSVGVRVDPDRDDLRLRT